MSSWPVVFLHWSFVLGDSPLVHSCALVPLRVVGMLFVVRMCRKVDCQPHSCELVLDNVERPEFRRGSRRCPEQWPGWMCCLCPPQEAFAEPLCLGCRTLFRTLARSHRLQWLLHLVVPHVQPRVLRLVLLVLFLQDIDKGVCQVATMYYCQVGTQNNESLLLS
jgi:hypothetical protein